MEIDQHVNYFHNEMLIPSAMVRPPAWSDRVANVSWGWIILWHHQKPKTAPSVRSDYQHATDIPKYSELNAMSFKARIYNVEPQRSQFSIPITINHR
jgi:hypothetical protein